METKHSENKNEQLAVTPVIGSPKFIPILFSTVMVQAILNCRKTQTRRIIKKKYSNTDIEWKIDKYGKRLVERQNDVPAPKVVKSEDGKTITTRHLTLFAEIKHPYKKGDVLWVRETFHKSFNPNEFCYKADTDNPIYLDKNWKWKPSLFMPKEACRIFLLVKSVRVEQLNEISGLDALNEGVFSLSREWVHKQFPEYAEKVIEWAAKDGIHKPPLGPIPEQRFMKLWQSINGNKSWEENPFVWVIEFERIERPTGFL